MSADRRDGPAGSKLGARHKTGLVGEREFQPYAPHGAERAKCLVSYTRKRLWYCIEQKRK